MRPALSVVAFTVLSGAGLGALAMATLMDLAGLARVATPWPTASLFHIAAVALALVVAGLCASTLHLGNPRNAWRSLSRWRSSWLSREALFAIALMGVATGWIATLAFDVLPAARVLLAIATLLLAWATLHCTAMIYASLKPIRQWHTRRVPLGYFVLGHASGALVVVAMLRAQGDPATPLSIAAGVLLFVAAAVKLDYYAYIASDRNRLTIEQAIGVPRGVHPPGPAGSAMRARILDVGHSKGTFLTNEFGYTLAPARRTALRLLLWTGVFAIPGLWLASGLAEWQGAAIACAACFAGLLAERWMFFAEARHTVRLYHGDRTT